MTSPCTSSGGTALHPLLSLPPSSPLLSSFLSSLSPSSSSPLPSPSISPYPDTVYASYPSLGLSLSFSPLLSSSFTPSSANCASLAQLLEKADELELTGIDVYNPSSPSLSSKPGRKPQKPDYDPFPSFPILLPDPPSSSSSAPVLLTPSTTGAQLVASLGEPQRKGGGGTGMGIWTEWVFPSSGQGKEEGGRKVAVMVEWASSGLGAWEKGGESAWRVCSVYLKEEEEGEGKK
ncbi:hypothetical protein JCM8547_004103 [Rhodosporidiobolus lusitaniae]